MYVKVLGAAAGGGSPQWNCSCSNCRRLREGTFPGTSRSQVQLAISADSEGWFLVNASPDLRYQIESFPALHPRDSSVRQSPINGVVLTSAELDAALGLLLLRESQPLGVYATSTVRSLLTEDNSLFGVLRREPDQVQWHTITPGQPLELVSINGRHTGIRCTPISTRGAFPAYVAPERQLQLDSAGAVIGLLIEHGSKRLAFFPVASTIRPEWPEQMEGCDAVLFDGTFWSDDELVRVRGKGKSARQMGHLPVGDPDGTLERFSSLTGPRKIFIHINNTNPMLDESSAEFARIRDYGWELASDGMQLCL
jgi:pyrroloquinoline quinone biosynthesis protein B